MAIQETERKQFKNISAQLTADFYEQVETRAHALKISKSELVRQALTEFIRSAEKVSQN